MTSKNFSVLIIMFFFVVFSLRNRIENLYAIPLKKRFCNRAIEVDKGASFDS